MSKQEVKDILTALVFTVSVDISLDLDDDYSKRILNLINKLAAENFVEKPKLSLLNVISDQTFEDKDILDEITKSVKINVIDASSVWDIT